MNKFWNELLALLDAESLESKYKDIYTYVSLLAKMENLQKEQQETQEELNKIIAENKKED